MLQIQMRILRVFGLSKAEMNSIIENAQAEGSPSLRLQERDGEYLVCVQASAPTQAMADEYCEKWVQKLRTRFGDACYGFEDTTLAQAALDALLKKRRLLVAADEATGRLLGNALRGLQHSEAAFDFGNQTYLNPANARRIAAPEALLKKFPGDMVQAAAGRAQSALLLANADYAAVYMPATVGQAPFVLLCSRIGAAACALSPEISDMAIANHILDLARRRALGMHLGPSAITFKPGRERPLLLVSGEGQPRPGFRFTLRRKAAPAKPAVKPNAPDSYDAEPVPDYDAQPTEPKPQAAPTGTITFERPIAQPAAPQPTPDPLDLRTAGPQAAAEARARRAAESELDPDLELCATRTIKISRADLEQAMAAQQAAKQQEQPNPEPPAAPQPEPLPEPEPLVSILIPNKDHVDDLEKCLFSLYSKTLYEAFEVIVIENNSTDPATKAYYEKLPDRYANCRVVAYSGGFNFSRINNFGRKFANGKFLLLLNNDIEIISGNWLTQMVAEASQPGVAACGAMLYYPDDTIQHAGIITGLGGYAGHSHKYHKRGGSGYMFRLATVQDYSACTAACLLVRTSAYDAVGGLDEAFTVAFNDVDFCLRLRERGWRIVWTPYAELYHHESKSRGSDEEDPAKKARFAKEQARLYEVHGKQNILHDPYYNPNLSLDYEDFRENGDLRNLKNVTL